MRRFAVLGAGMWLVLSGCIAAAQTTVTNLFGSLSKYQVSAPLFDSNRLTVAWASRDRYAEPQFVVGSDAPVSLEGSLDGARTYEAWTLFLADLDFGEPAASVPWGQIVAAIPEPSTGTLLALGAIALGTHLRRRRNG